MVELLVAVVVLAVGVLSLAATVGVVSRTMTASLLSARVRFAAQAGIERLLTIPADRLSSGEERHGDVVVSWQIIGGEPRQLLLVAGRALGAYEATDTLATLVGTR